MTIEMRRHDDSQGSASTARRRVGGLTSRPWWRAGLLPIQAGWVPINDGSVDAPRHVKPETMRGAVDQVLRWLAGIGATLNKPTEYVSRPRRPASEIAAETCAESAAEEAVAISAATESAAFATPVTADAMIGQKAPDLKEIQRRRELVRTMFNAFWNGCDDKPAAFVDRLDQAETYLNERLAACGEFWLLDANTRKMLGLPPRSN